jgi:Mn2+/Fe2+ NRAMP family transporter
VNSPRSRKGSPEDRGKVLRFPASERPAPAKAGLFRRISALAPGIVTGTADLDPSAVITATVAGAAFRYSLVWVVILCIPFLATIFSVTSRIGTQTQKGLVDLLRENYGRKWALTAAILTIVSSTAVVIADLMAVSDGVGIILNQERTFFIAVTAFSVWFILIFRDYRKITKILVFLSLPLYLYVAAAFLTVPSLSVLLREVFVPHAHLTAEYVEGIVALFGSFLTPYILLWQVSSRGDKEHEPHRADAHAATAVSAVLALSVLIAAGSVLHFAHPVDMTTREAAGALRPIVGNWGAVLFALGMVGSGLVALPVLVASMCYDMAQALGWRYGLSEHPWEAKAFYVLISGAMFLAAVANYFHINTVAALYWSMILAGLLTIPTLIFILVVGNDRRIMQTVNTAWQNFWIGAAAGGIVAVGGLYAYWKL